VSRSDSVPVTSGATTMLAPASLAIRSITCVMSVPCVSYVTRTGFSITRMPPVRSSTTQPAVSAAISSASRQGTSESSSEIASYSPGIRTRFSPVCSRR
jgi:hypothetical protein